MSRGKNCLPTVSRQFLTRNYPRPNCLLKCLPNCLSPTKEGFVSSFKINPAVRAIARQVRDKNCLAAIFAPRHQSVSSGPLGTPFLGGRFGYFFCFSVLGEGRGESEASGRRGSLKIPERGGVRHPGEGGAEGPGGCLQGIRGGGA